MNKLLDWKDSPYRKPLILKGVRQVGKTWILKEGARAREYEDALQWLVDARLVHKIYRSTAPGLPVAAYDDLSAFKISLASGRMIFSL